MDFLLYYQPGTRSQRVRWLLEELGLNYQLEIFDLFKGDGNTAEYRALHPLGQLPVLKIDGTAMFESGAIVEWLADTNPDKNLSPAIDSPHRREFNQWMYFSVTNLEAPAWEIMLHSNILPKEIAIKEIIPFATKNYLAVMKVLDEQLEGKSYMINNQFSAVDIMIGYILLWYPQLVEPFSNVKTYTQNLQQRPAYLRSKQD